MNHQQKINRFMAEPTLDGRRAIKERFALSDTELKQKWLGGNICGQCKHFSQLGINTPNGLNGVCAKAVISDWIKPENPKCNKFSKNE